MDVEQAVHERLKTVVTLAANRVSAAPAPDSWPVPLVTHQLIGGAPEIALGGITTTWLASFQVTIWAKNYEEMMPVVAQVRTALAGWQIAFDGLEVDFAWIETQRDLQDSTIDPPLIGRAFDVILSCEGGG